ncbi:hypothetical protein GCM10010413_36890 [Promicromonospora sukumoe]
MHRLRATVTAVFALALGGIAIPASADPHCKAFDRDSGVCVIIAHDPGSASAQVSDDSASAASGRSEAPAKPARRSSMGSACTWEPQGSITIHLDEAGGPVPCTSEYGVWSEQWNCYLSRAIPQPPATAPEWEGHEQGDGAIYECRIPTGGLQGAVWLATPPDAADAGPTPGEVAQIAVERMNLRAVEIGMSPDPDGPGVVALPTWLWVHDPGEQTFGPITRTASAGSVTVSATARVERIVWDMGDGTQVVCTGPGTPYEFRFARQASPDCGHIYTRESGYRPGQEYTVTATSEWVVDWEGAGQSGSLDVDDLSRSVQVSVGEAQVLVN